MRTGGANAAVITGLTGGDTTLEIVIVSAAGAAIKIAIGCVNWD